MKWKGFRDFRATLIIDLTKSEEELKNSLHKDARRYLKKSYESGLIFNESNEWDKFYPIYRDVAIKGNIIPISFEELNKTKLFLLIIKQNEKIIGGLVINFEEGIPNMMINAIKEKYYYTFAGYFAYWNMILWTKNNGYSKLDLGGYQLNAKDKLNDINKFKDKWGGEVVTFKVYSKNPFYIIARKIIRNFSTIKKVNDKLKIFRYLVIRSLGKYGLKLSIKKLFAKFIFDKSETVLFSSNLENIPNLSPRIECAFKKADEEDFKELIKTKEFVFPEILWERLDSGNECYLFMHDSKINHYSWVNYSEMDISESKIKIQLNKDEFCIFDCNTPEKYRGLNLYPTMLCKIQIHLKDKGFAKSFIYADRKNIPSIKGIEKAGFKEIGFFKYLNFFGFKKKKKSLFSSLGSPEL